MNGGLFLKALSIRHKERSSSVKVLNNFNIKAPKKVMFKTTTKLPMREGGTTSFRKTNTLRSKTRSSSVKVRGKLNIKQRKPGLRKISGKVLLKQNSDRMMNDLLGSAVNDLAEEDKKLAEKFFKKIKKPRKKLSADQVKKGWVDSENNVAKKISPFQSKEKFLSYRELGKLVDEEDRKSRKIIDVFTLKKNIDNTLKTERTKSVIMPNPLHPSKTTIVRPNLDIGIRPHTNRLEMNNELDQDRFHIIGNSNKETLLPISQGKINAFNNLCNQFKDNLTSHRPSPEPKKKDSFSKLRSTSTFSVSSGAKFYVRIDERNQKEKIYRQLFFRNQQVYDSLSEDEDEIDEIDEPLIHPFSRNKKIFDLVVLCSILTLTALVPLEMVMRHEERKPFYYFSLINFAGDIIAIIDLFASFVTGFYDINDILVTDTKRIVLNYIASYFMLDFLCAIPFGTYYEMVFMIDKGRIHSTIELIKYIKFLKLLKFRDNAAVDMIYFKLIITSVGNHLVTICTIVLYVLFIHILCSAYVIIGLSYSPSWIDTIKTEETSGIDLYVASFQFIFVTVTSVGYGDLHPFNIAEKFFGIFLLSVGVVMNSWLVSTIGEYGNVTKLRDLNKGRIQRFRQKLKILDEMRLIYGNEEKFFRIKKCLIYNFDQQMFNSKEVFGFLPHALKCELIEVMYKPILTNFVFFKKFNNRNFIIEVVAHFTSVLYTKNERLLNPGEFVEEVLFVKNGKLSVELPLPGIIHEQINKYREIHSLTRNDTVLNLMDNSQNFEIQYARLVEIRKFEHYGDMHMFLNLRNDLSIRVSTRIVELFLLKKNDAVTISQDFPKIFKEVIRHSIYNMNELKQLIKKALDVFYDNNSEMLGHLYELHQLYTEIKDTMSMHESGVKDEPKPKDSPSKDGANPKGKDTKPNPTGMKLTFAACKELIDQAINKERYVIDETKRMSLRRESKLKALLSPKKKMVVDNSSSKKDTTFTSISNISNIKMTKTKKDEEFNSESDQNESKRNLLAGLDKSGTSVLSKLVDSSCPGSPHHSRPGSPKHYLRSFSRGSKSPSPRLKNQKKMQIDFQPQFNIKSKKQQKEDNFLEITDEFTRGEADRLANFVKKNTCQHSKNQSRTTLLTKFDISAQRVDDFTLNDSDFSLNKSISSTSTMKRVNTERIRLSDEDKSGSNLTPILNISKVGMMFSNLMSSRENMSSSSGCEDIAVELLRKKKSINNQSIRKTASVNSPSKFASSKSLFSNSKLGNLIIKDNEEESKATGNLINKDNEEESKINDKLDEFFSMLKDLK